jgi:hypothetical protein
MPTSDLFYKVCVLVAPGLLVGSLPTPERQRRQDRMCTSMRKLYANNPEEALRGDDFFVPFDEMLDIGENDEGTGMDCPPEAQALFTLLWLYALATAPDADVVAATRTLTDVAVNGL